jgi:hypothetical protein
MLGRLSLIALLPMLVLATPASAATKEQKMEICKFGADDQKLAGAKRNAFMAKCMSNKNDKRGPAAKPAAATAAKPKAAPKATPAAAPAATPAPAPAATPKQ